MKKMLFDCWGKWALKETAIRLGIDAEIYDFESALDDASNEEEANDTIIRDVLSAKADILLVEEGAGHSGRHITRNTIRFLKKRGVKTVFVEWNVPYRDGNTLEGIRKRYGDYPEEYDLRFFSYQGAVDIYNQIHLPTVFVRKMYDGRIYPYNSLKESEKIYDVAMCGTSYDRPKQFSRKEMALEFIRKKYKLALCGKGWDVKGVGYISGDRKLRKYTMGKLPQRMLPPIYSKSKINIGTLLVDYEGYLGARPFEVMGSGNFFMLGNVHDGIRKIFEDGKEIVYFDNLDDLYEKIEFYMKRPELRAEIAKAARSKVMQEFTFDKSCETIMRHVMELS